MNYYKKIGDLQKEYMFIVELYNEWISIKPSFVFDNKYKKIINTKERLYKILEEDIFKNNSYYTILIKEDEIIIKKYKTTSDDYFLGKKDLKKSINDIFDFFKLKEFEYEPEKNIQKIKYPNAFENSKINHTILKRTIKASNIRKNSKKELEDILEDLERKYTKVRKTDI